VDAAWRYASDFELWVRFFRHAQLYTVDSLIGGFREHRDSDSLQQAERFNARCDAIARAELKACGGGWLMDKFLGMSAAMQKAPKVRYFWYTGKKYLLRGLYEIPGPDWPPMIRCDRFTQDWKLVK
jgi:hypothetical protein